MELRKKIKENPWILTTIVLGLIILIFLVGNVIENSQSKTIEINKVQMSKQNYNSIMKLAENNFAVFIIANTENRTATIATLDILENNSTVVN